MKGNNKITNQNIWKLFIIVIFMTIPTMVRCQDFSFKGSIRDSLERKIPFATVAFYNSSDSSYRYSILSDSLGDFVLMVNQGTYFIGINHLNFKPFYKEIKINNSKEEIFHLESSILFLDETEIISRRNQMQMRDGNLRYVPSEMKADPNMSLGNLLNQIPELVLDFQNNIKINGLNAKISLDGRPVNLSEINTIPISRVANITVIDNPSSKYDSDGLSGILNIETKQKKLTDQMSTQLGLNLSEKLQTSNLEFGIHKEKLHLMTSFTAWHNIQEGSIEIQNPKPRMTDIRASIYNVKGSIDAIWKIRSNEQASFAYALTSKGFNAQDSAINSNGNSKMRAFMNQLSFDYENQRNKHGGVLNIQVFYNTTNPKTQSLFFRNEFEYQNNIKNDNSSLIAKVDYTLPINKISTLESGIMNKNRWLHISRFGNLSGVHQDHRFHLKEHSLSSFLMLSTKSKLVDFKTGVRAETLLTENYQGSRKWDLFPYLNLDYALSEKANFTIYYNKRIRRPSASDLNPYTVTLDPNNQFRGKPELKPEHSHSVGIKMRFKNGNKLLAASAFYRLVNNLISRLPELEKKQVIYRPLNIKQSSFYGTKVSTSWQLENWGEIQASVGLTFSKIKDNVPKEISHITTFNLGLVFTAKLPGDFNIRTSGKYISPSLSIGTSSQSAIVQGLAIQRSQIISDISISKSFKDKSFNLSIKVTDPLNLMRTGYAVYSEITSYKTNYHLQTRTIQLGINYRFNTKSSKKASFEDGGIKVVD